MTAPDLTALVGRLVRAAEAPDGFDESALDGAESALLAAIDALKQRAEEAEAALREATNLDTRDAEVMEANARAARAERLGLEACDMFGALYARHSSLRLETGRRLLGGEPRIVDIRAALAPKETP